MEKRAHFLGERGERPRRNGVTYLPERLGWRFGLPLAVNSVTPRCLDSILPASNECVLTSGQHNVQAEIARICFFIFIVL